MDTNTAPGTLSDAYDTACRIGRAYGAQDRATVARLTHYAESESAGRTDRAVGPAYGIAARLGRDALAMLNGAAAQYPENVDTLALYRAAAPTPPAYCRHCAEGGGHGGCLGGGCPSWV